MEYRGFKVVVAEDLPPDGVVVGYPPAVELGAQTFINRFMTSTMEYRARLLLTRPHPAERS